MFSNYLQLIIKFLLSFKADKSQWQQCGKK